jgi:hypothetical protein
MIRKENFWTDACGFALMSAVWTIKLAPSFAQHQKFIIKDCGGVSMKIKFVSFCSTRTWAYD